MVGVPAGKAPPIRDEVERILARGADHLSSLDYRDYGFLMDYRRVRWSRCSRTFAVSLAPWLVV
jgi:hypothetical protein